MPYDPHLADRMRTALARRPGISERAMFGGFCWMLHGNMLCGVEVGRFMFRVGKELEPPHWQSPAPNLSSSAGGGWVAWFGSTRRPAEAVRLQAGSRSPRVSSVRYRRNSERRFIGAKSRGKRHAWSREGRSGRGGQVSAINLLTSLA